MGLKGWLAVERRKRAQKQTERARVCPIALELTQVAHKLKTKFEQNK